MTTAHSTTAAVLTLIAVVDPLGTSAIFVGLHPIGAPVWRRASRAAASATAILLCAAVAGARLEASAVPCRVAFQALAGLALMVTAVGIGRPPSRGTDSRFDPFLFPLTIPLLAGPGCVATTLALAAERAGDPMAILDVSVAIVTAEATALATLIVASRCADAMEPSARRSILDAGRAVLATVAVVDLVKALRAIAG